MTAETVAARWERQVRARLEETMALRRDNGYAADLWSGRARRFAAVVGRATRAEPVLSRLLAERATTYVDVGAGTGRYAVPLARAGRSVSAIEPSPGMRAVLGTHPRLTVVAEAWPERVVTGEVIFAAHVLFLIPPADAFVRAMTRSARRACYLVLAGVHSDALYDPLWRHFHGRSRAPSPTFLDAVELLRASGARPTFEIVPGSGGARYATVARAITDLRELLCLGRSTDLDRELRSVAASWLVQGQDGVRAPGTPLPVAIIRWTPDPTRSSRPRGSARTTSPGRPGARPAAR